MRLKALTLAAVTALAATFVAVADAAAPTNTSAPTIEGQLVVGETVATGNGRWNGSPTDFSYQWLRCNEQGAACAKIGSATERTYTIADADEGHTLIVLVTAKNADGSAGPINSKPSDLVSAAAAPQNTTPPQVTGKAEVGEALAADAGKYAGGLPTKFAYQWQRCDQNGAACEAVTGATSVSYGVRTADVDHTLRVRVTASNAYGSDIATSDRTKVVTALPAAEPDVVTTTFAVSRGATVCCQLVRLSGTVSSQRAGESVIILARQVDQPTPVPVKTVKSNAAGDWTTTVRPTIQTTYLARTGVSSSPQVTVRVAPRVGIGFGRHVWSTKVTARDSFAGKIVLFQGRTASGGWQTLQRVVLNLGSSARFTAPVPRSIRWVRASIPSSEVGEGYVAGTSKIRRAEHS